MHLIYLYARFLSNRQRMNVALTRSRRAVYTLGHFDTLQVLLCPRLCTILLCYPSTFKCSARKHKNCSFSTCMYLVSYEYTTCACAIINGMSHEFYQSMYFARNIQKPKYIIYECLCYKENSM